MVHHPVVLPKIQPPVDRVDPELLRRFELPPVPDISDAVGQLYTMNANIRPLYSPMKRLVGQALTVKSPPGDNLTVHGALEMVRPGDVLVVDWRGYVGGCATGADSLVVPISRGLVGAVVDGGWRDVGQLRDMGVPIFAQQVSPFSPPKSRPGEINVPVCCGGVIVHPGDIVVGDEEGIAVVPLADIETVLAAVGSAGAKNERLRDFDEAERFAAYRYSEFHRVVRDSGADAGRSAAVADDGRVATRPDPDEGSAGS